MLVPAHCRMKTLAVGTLIAVVVLLGVFCPTFAMQILNGILALAIFLVLVLWTVAAVFHLQRRRTPVPAAGAAPPSRDSGVDLSQYQPHHTEPAQSQAPATPEAPKPADGNGAEGGTSHA
jgi:predicted lipid-binding transport protein (Tim44 family)